MERKPTVTRGRKRRPPKSKTLASKLLKNPIQSLQSVQTSLKTVSKIQNQKNLEEMEDKNGETKAWESLKNPNPYELVD